MADKEIYQLLTRSIEKGVIKNEKELSMAFVKGYNFWRKNW